MKILSGVGSLINNLQGKKILKKISKQKDDGFFKSELEFKQSLKNNLVEAANSQDQPLFVPLVYSPGIAFSEIHNNNISDILLDLEVVFDEINFVFSKIKSHEIFFERSIHEAETLIKKVEQNIESAKIEASVDNAFNKIFHNSFIDASNKVDFTNPIAKEVYYDAILKKRGNADTLCHIDTNQGVLSLPKFLGKDVVISEVSIVSTETTVSDYNISFPGNNISNIISPSIIDSWSYSVLLKKQLKDKAKLVVALNFGDIKEFNSISINPNASEPSYLKEVYILDSNGTKEILESDIGLITEAKTIVFKRKLSKAIYLTFEQDRNKIIPYDPTRAITLAELQRDPSLPLTIDTISSQIRSNIKDPSVKNILGLNTKVVSSDIFLYYYTFSINSVQVKNDDFKKIGIYVSQPETYTNLRNLGIYSKEVIPTALHWQTNIEMLSGSIEYSFFKQDFDDQNRLIRTSLINVLPIGIDQVENERLHFTSASSTALRFLAHKADGDGSGLEIYRNGELLIRGVDWHFQKRQSVDLSDPFVDLDEDKTIISITQTNEQIYNGVYTAKYIPRYISEPETLVVDNANRFVENGSILIPNIINGQEIKRTEVYVQIIIRNHTDSNSSTPYVDYYRLAGKEE